MYIQAKPCFQLLEVMIAMFLIILCAVPIMNAYIGINQAQYQNARLHERDHLAHLIHGKVVESLYKRSIPWPDIAQGQEEKLEKLGFTDELSQLERLSYEASYQLKVKSNKNSQDDVLLELQLLFKDKLVPGRPSFSYVYLIYAKHELPPNQIPDPNDPNANRPSSTGNGQNTVGNDQQAGLPMPKKPSKQPIKKK